MLQTKISISRRAAATCFYAVLLAPIFFLTSYILLDAYTAGDQRAYHKFYDALKGSSLLQMMLLARSYVSSSEPLSALILWVGSNLDINKNVYVSILNLSLMLGIFTLARRYYVRGAMSFLMLSNFYVIVLLTSAERLKIAVLIMVLAALCSGKTRLVLLALSPFAHLQSLLFFPSLFLAASEPHLRRLLKAQRIKRQVLRLTFPAALAGAVVIGPLFEGVLRKASVYLAQDISSFELLNVALLSVISLVVTRNRARMCCVLAPLYVAISFIGGTRVNMIAVFLVFYLLMLEQRLQHPLIYFLMLYFLYKAVFFIENILLYGDGFH